ncbi:MAG TPA: pyridoxamine 5'-phosphate oxidase family protein [Stellaceae bacterium]|nr:pyridoxamine 5'-phosphate oxidase family protein [Stellaceae bacterium]
MAQQTETVAKFLSSIKSGQLAADLLADDAGFQALNINQKGKAAVIERFKGGNYAEANWATPEDKAGAVQAVGTLPNASKIVLTVHVAGGKISLLQQQGVPGNPRPATELKIPADLKERLNNALKERHPIMITYVDESGQPNLTFRGSTQVFSDTQLAIWVRNGNGKMIRSIQKNPKVALMYRDEDAKATYTIQGRAHIDSSEAARKQVYDTMAQVERDHDFAHLGVAMIIDLDLIEGYGGLSPQGQINPIRMTRAK